MADERTCPHCGKPVPPTALEGICPECMLKAGLATHTEGPGGTKVVHPPPQPSEIAALFPQLEILECLGRGGMGVVYKARQPRLNRIVALKILARDKEENGQFAERFAREARALARLSHPNIVTVHDFGEAGGHCYLLMEFVDGLSLRQLLQAGTMMPAQALGIVPKICEALQYAHEQGIVHRDIKPENILLDKQGRVKIADFGIAKMVGAEAGQQTLTGAKDVVGTPHYMAPEQIEKPMEVDHRADIYSLGVVFYEMLTGELPLGKFAAPSKRVEVDVRLDEIVLRALEKEPRLRYQQASVLKTEVETVAATPAAASPHARSSDAISGGTAPTPPPPARVANGGPNTALTVAAMTVTETFAMLALGNLISAPLANVSRLVFHGTLLLLLASPFIAAINLWLLRRWGERGGTAGRAWLRALSVVAWVLAIPCIGFGLFFINALRSESGGWHPTPNEALFVPLTWLGALLLPFSGILLSRKRAIAPPHVAPARTGSGVAFAVLGCGGLLLAGLVGLAAILWWSYAGRRMSVPGAQASPSVTLLAVEGMTANGVEMWAPDGSGVSAELRTKLDSMSPPPMNWPPNRRAFWISISNAPAEALDQWIAKTSFATVSRAGHVVGSSGSETSRDGRGTILRFAMDALPGQRPATDYLRFGFPVKPWRTLSVWKGDPLSLVESHWPNPAPSKEITLQSFRQKRIPAFDPREGVGLREASGTEIQFRVPAHLHLEATTMWRLEVTDKQGRQEIRTLYQDLHNSDGQRTGGTIWHSEVERTNIQTITLRGLFTDEDFHWVEFPDVALEPGLRPGQSINGPLAGSTISTPPGQSVSHRQSVVLIGLFKIFLVLLIIAILGGAVLAVVLAAVRKTSGGKAILAGIAVVGGIAILLAAVVLAIVIFSRSAAHGPASVRSSSQPADQIPTAAHLSTNGRSAFLVHDNTDLHYALYHEGSFTSSGATQRNTRWMTWLEDNRIRLRNGRSFGCQRDAVNPLFLRINGHEFDLRAGRVFVLNNDGTADQIALQPSLLAARDVGQLPGLIASAAGRLMELVVASDGSGTHRSVQAAIDAALEGATIRIGPGRYDESLVITQRLSLVGAGWEKTVIGPTKPWASPSREALAELERTIRAAASDDERARLLEQAARLQPPVISVTGAKGVVINGIKFTQPGLGAEGRLEPFTVMKFADSEGTVSDCAVVGSPGNGVVTTGNADVQIHRTLIAAAWNSGVRVERGSRAAISGSDIRNCHYAGVVIGRNANATIERCRISGAAWHGIRYDDVSPTIADNLIFDNARSGIYASGSTSARVRGNVFFANEMNGMSCWFTNRDEIIGNTFAGNLREALSVLGQSAPAIRSNIFNRHPIGIYQGLISGDANQALGDLAVTGNLFHANGTNWFRHPGSNEVAVLDIATHNLAAAPVFRDEPARDFALANDSPARAAGIGAMNPLELASPWPLQPEEKAIIPEGNTRDSRQWKRPERP